MPAETTQTLQEVVQGYRDKAREILRMQMISNLLQQLFHDDCNVETAQKNVASMEKDLEVSRYNKNKLDEKHPNFGEQSERADEEIKFLTKRIEDLQARVTDTEKQKENTLAEIAKVEKGEIKVSINEVKNLTDQMVMKA